MSNVVASFRNGVKLRYRPRHDSKAARKRRRRAQVTKAERRQVFDRDGHQCVVCGSCRDLQADHIIPVAKGGTKEMDNLQTLCAACNYVKGDRLDAFAVKEAA